MIVRIILFPFARQHEVPSQVHFGCHHFLVGVAHILVILLGCTEFLFLPGKITLVLILLHALVIAFLFSILPFRFFRIRQGSSVINDQIAERIHRDLWQILLEGQLDSQIAADLRDFNAEAEPLAEDFPQRGIYSGIRRRRLIDLAAPGAGLGGHLFPGIREDEIRPLLFADVRRQRLLPFAGVDIFGARRGNLLRGRRFRGYFLHAVRERFGRISPVMQNRRRIA